MIGKFRKKPVVIEAARLGAMVEGPIKLPVYIAESDCKGHGLTLVDANGDDVLDAQQAGMEIGALEQIACALNAQRDQAGDAEGREPTKRGPSKLAECQRCGTFFSDYGDTPCTNDACPAREAKS